MHNQNGRLNTGTTVVAKLTFVPTMGSHPHQYGVRLRGLVVLCQCVLEGSYEFVGVKWRNAVIMITCRATWTSHQLQIWC